MSELVKRLRSEGKGAFIQPLSLGMFRVCTEAADRIEALEAELQGRDEAKELLLDRIEALEAALRTLVTEYAWCVDRRHGLSVLSEAIQIARAALDKDAGQ